MGVFSASINPVSELQEDLTNGRTIIRMRISVGIFRNVDHLHSIGFPATGILNNSVSRQIDLPLGWTGEWGYPKLVELLGDTQRESNEWHSAMTFESRPDFGSRINWSLYGDTVNLKVGSSPQIGDPKQAQTIEALATENQILQQNLTQTTQYLEAVLNSRTWRANQLYSRIRNRLRLFIPLRSRGK